MGDQPNNPYLAIIDAIDEQIIKPLMRRYCEMALEHIENREGNREMTDKQLTAHMSQYIDNFITRRFPEGIDGAMRDIVAEIVLDAFSDGCRFNEEQREAAESTIILPPH